MSTRYVIKNETGLYYGKDGWVRFIRSALFFTSMIEAFIYMEQYHIDGKVDPA